MRVKTKAAEAVPIVQGPGKFLLRNKTAGASIFLEVGALEEGAEPKPLATEAAGYEWEHTEAPLTVELVEGEVLTGIVKSGEAEQIVHVLRTAGR